MSSMPLTQDHIAYRFVPDVREMCKPPMQYFHVASFSYVKINPDLSRVHLFTHPEWVEFYYNNVAKYIVTGEVTEACLWASGYTTLMSLNDPCTQDFIGHRLGDGVLLSNQVDGCNELCFFANRWGVKHSILVNMLCEIDLLHAFVRYFRQRAAKLIQQLEDNPIILPLNVIDTNVKTFKSDCAERTEFIANITSNNLTKREQQCLLLLKQDMSSKMIARKMGIKSKTVDRHIENIKSKLGARKRSALVKIVNDQ